MSIDINMAGETPNKKYLDRWLEQMSSRYQYEELQQMPISKLRSMKSDVECRFFAFRKSFPNSNAAMQGERRAEVYVTPTDTRQSLSTVEIQRLRQAKLDIKREIDRAIGFRKDQRRERRSDWMNSVVEIADKAVAAVFAICATVWKAIPW